MQEEDKERPQDSAEEAAGEATAAPAEAGHEGAGEAAAAAAAAAGSGDGARVEELEFEVAKLKDQLLRQLAETENVRRRAERERNDAARYGASGFAKDLLSVADNLQRALQALPPGAADENEAVKNLVVGIEITEKELRSAFEKHGIRPVGAVGEPFSYDLHQAMYEVPGTGQPAGTIVEMMQPGYVMHDRLLRPAMVGVAKAEPQGGDEDKGDGRVDTTA